MLISGKKPRQMSNDRLFARFGSRVLSNFFTLLELKSWKTKQNPFDYHEHNKREVQKSIAIPILAAVLVNLSSCRQCYVGVLCFNQKQNSGFVMQSVSNCIHQFFRRKKPTVALDYNVAVGVVNTADMMPKEFSCHRISKN